MKISTKYAIKTYKGKSKKSRKGTYIKVWEEGSKKYSQYKLDPKLKEEENIYLNLKRHELKQKGIKKTKIDIDKQTIEYTDKKTKKTHTIKATKKRTEKIKSHEYKQTKQKPKQEPKQKTTTKTINQLKKLLEESEKNPSINTLIKKGLHSHEFNITTKITNTQLENQLLKLLDKSTKNKKYNHLLVKQQNLQKIRYNIDTEIYFWGMDNKLAAKVKCFNKTPQEALQILKEINIQHGDNLPKDPSNRIWELFKEHNFQINKTPNKDIRIKSINMNITMRGL